MLLEVLELNVSLSACISVLSLLCALASSCLGVFDKRNWEQASWVAVCMH